MEPLLTGGARVIARFSLSCAGRLGLHPDDGDLLSLETMERLLDGWIEPGGGSKRLQVGVGVNVIQLDEGVLCLERRHWRWNRRHKLIERLSYGRTQESEGDQRAKPSDPSPGQKQSWTEREEHLCPVGVFLLRGIGQAVIQRFGPAGFESGGTLLDYLEGGRSAAQWDEEADFVRLAAGVEQRHKEVYLSRILCLAQAHDGDLFPLFERCPQFGVIINDGAAVGTDGEGQCDDKEQTQRYPAPPMSQFHSPTSCKV
jgi:hypothetical protein